MVLKLVRILLVFVILPLFSWSCHSSRGKQNQEHGILKVFHAGSLSVPMKNIAEAFEKENPGVRIQLEAGGSLTCVRKITELHQHCDILALADYGLIDELIIPGHARWNVLFATNELCLVYTEKSRKSNQINPGNWFDVLMDSDVHYGRSDPNSDPCGYRTILALKLAAGYYPEEKDWSRLLEKDTRFIRGKETDLNSLLETQSIDYMFNYRSVAVQHNFKYLRFPDSVNLSNPALDPWYASATVEIRGTSPGSRIEQKGACIVYGITIPSDAPNPRLAEKFIRFLLDPGKGRLIFINSGQNPLEPRYSIKSKPDRELF